MPSKVFTMVGGGAGGDIELSEITITSPPDKTDYLPGEVFNPAGLEVKATYSNGATMMATGWSYSPDTGLPEGTEYVTIMYSEGGITKTAQQPVTVERATVEVPTYTGSLTYTGTEQTPTFNGYDQTKMTISGDTSATDAGEYAAIFTTTSQYKWPDDTTDGKSVAWSIARADISEPTQSGSLTYNGNSQSPTWIGYDTTKMTIGGQTSGVNAGAYTATFTPKTNYEWTDGTTAAKEVVWNIGKAVPVLTVSPTSVELTADADTKTSAVTYNGDGTLSAQSQDDEIATATLSGTTVTITGVGSGDTTVNVNASAGTNYSAASTPISVSADIGPVGVSFATDSWETIAAVSEAGTASQYYQIGDTKDITLSGIGTMTLEIADFDHDYLSASTSAQKAGISIITKDLLYSTRQMNTSGTNNGGFPDSALYDYLSTTVWNALPAELRNVVKTCYKWYGTGNNTTNGAWHGSKLWIPLEYEMFGSNTYSPATERTTGNARKYPIFTDNTSRIKRKNNGSGSAYYYWEASPRASYTAYFCIVSSGGDANYSGASFSYGVCFGLSI